MNLAALALLLPALAAATSDPPSSGSADVVALKDGREVLGEVIEAPPRGPVQALLRRQWASEHCADLLARWEAAERKDHARPITERLHRLAVWKADRERSPGLTGDLIGAWIKRETERLEKTDAATSSPLVRARIPRAEVRAVERAPKGQTRALRLGWLAGFPGPEAMRPADLAEALRERGFDLSETAPVDLERLLPPPPETERNWLVRRAATEVTYDTGLKFIRHSGFFAPEPAPGQAIEPTAAIQALSATLKQLVEGGPEVSIDERLRPVADTGHVGAIITQAENAPDFDWASVEITLMVRTEAGRWTAAGSRVARVQTADVGPKDLRDVAADPQVAALFKLVEGLGLGGIDGAAQGKSLKVGAAAREALGQARALAAKDLATLALPVE